MSAIVIQAAVRSFLTRCWLRVWKRKRVYYIVRCQAHLRRRITHKRWTTRKEIEYLRARSIQNLVRIYLAKCNLILMERIHLVNIIAAHYHGCKARQMYTLMRKGHYVIKIQAFFRVCLCTRAYEKLSKDKYCAAREIQRCWRGYLSKQLSSTLLRDRYIDSCQTQIQMFMSEADYYTSSHTNLERHVSDASNQPTTQKKDYDSIIRENEIKIDDLQRTLSQLSPRLVQQGWKEQMERSIRFERATLTKNKMNTMFQTLRMTMVDEMNFDKHEKKRIELSKKVESIQQRKNELALFLLKDSQSFQRKESKRKQKQAIADEKRRWAVKHKVENGKPFKQSCHKNLAIPNNDSNEQRLINMLKMQNYYMQLSQLDNAIKPLNKLSTVR